ncbi:MAG TPA: DUF4115 domain-containing protein [Alphaproteobacteria bacterium]|nr:helix-turn-helix domain-containing protein [Alphaproteobacteria bacterium]HOO49780.1 DUF4115 domain-containing protein [Alphaproteobacteria bacterium]
MSDDFKQKKYHHKETEDLLRDFHTDLSVGDIIQRTRIRSDITLEQAAQETRIRLSYLEAIEEGNYDQLPGRIYAIGFIRTYAEFLNLDGEKIVQLLKRQSGTKVAPKPLPTTAPVDEDHSLPSLKTYVIVLVMLISGLTVFSYAFKSNISRDLIPSVPLDLKKQVTLLTKPQSHKTALGLENNSINEEIDLTMLDENPDTEEAAIEKEPTSNEHPVVLRALDNVWLEIRSSEGNVILSRVLSKGEEYWVPEDQENLEMTLGNAGGLQILVDGKPLPFLGKKGKVIRNLPLAPQYLMKMFKNTQR